MQTPDGGRDDADRDSKTCTSAHLYSIRYIWILQPLFTVQDFDPPGSAVVQNGNTDLLKLCRVNLYHWVCYFFQWSVAGNFKL